jgi:hypothetical protein
MGGYNAKIREIDNNIKAAARDVTIQAMIDGVPTDNIISSLQDGFIIGQYFYTAVEEKRLASLVNFCNTGEFHE